MITWELAERLIFERGLAIPVFTPREYETVRLYEVAKELEELYTKQEALHTEIVMRAREQRVA